MAALAGSALAAGMSLGAASTLSIGPNNLMLVREGLGHGRTALVASSVCASSLILLGSALVLTDRIAAGNGLITTVVPWAGLAALLWFAVVSIRTAFGAGSPLAIQRSDREDVAHCLGRVFATVWLNPLTYVEMLLVPASICSNFPGMAARLCFAFGSSVVLSLSCFGYAFGGVLFSRLFARRETLRWFDLGSGAVLLTMSGVLGFELAMRPH